MKPIEFVKKHGLLQFLNIYHSQKDRTKDKLKWGDEVRKEREGEKERKRRKREREKEKKKRKRKRKREREREREREKKERRNNSIFKTIFRLNILLFCWKNKNNKFHYL